MSIKTEDGVEFLIEMCNRSGVACSSVKDGQVFLFKRSVLEKIIANNLDKELISIFVKRPDVQ